ncbi:hypothetical protein [Dyella telluris]|uniref:Secreted protein n=1 Tax=Dyella telluris TaxID=2763498 RepID=A0A7G8Q3V1_9GAMM|nr:hypothetical protein [Dyella telluris]QNK01459.1 hypothetical protein H8F01_20895 [Dyella telluris]
MPPCFRLRVWLVAGMVVMGVCRISPVAADELQPALPHEVVMGVATNLTRQVSSSQSFSIPTMRFEPATQEWVIEMVTIEAVSGEKHFLITLNESTGLACLRSLPGVACVAKADIRQQVAEARARADAELMAKTHPAPDLQGMAEALIRYQFDPQRTGAGASTRASYFVLLQSPDSSRGTDLAPEVVARLKRDGIETLPGSSWKPPEDPQHPVSPLQMQYSIGLPVRRADGNYDVSFGYYCGSLCAGSYKAVMKHDATGWHVVSTVMEAVS